MTKSLQIIVLIIFALFVNKSFAHKDRVYRNTYGNVKTMIRTGFTFSEIQKVQIIGRLTEELLGKLQYKDTVLLEFRHDYTNRYSDFKLVELGNTQIDYLLNHGNFSIKTQRWSHRKTTVKGICVRQIGKEFDILSTLKLVEYSVLNKKKFKNEKIFFLDEGFNENGEIYKNRYKFLGLNLSKVSEVLFTKQSSLLKSILDTEVQFIDKLNIKGLWRNFTYTFTNGKLEFNSNQLFCVLELKKGLIIFETCSKFKYLSENITKIEAKIIESSCCNKPYFLSFNKDKLVKTLRIIQPFCSGNGFLFSESKNKILKKKSKDLINKH